MMKNKEEELRWLRDGGEKLQHNFEGIGPESIVFDIGLHKGLWSAAMVRKYNCYIYGFEPVKTFYKDALSVKVFADNPKVKLFNFGFAGNTRQAVISVDGASSSLVGISNKHEMVQVVSIKDFISESKIDFIDLASINIEGAEYELLDFMFSENLMPKFDRILLQFHEHIKIGNIGHLAERNAIRKRLSLTHKMVYSYELKWDYWVKKGLPFNNKVTTTKVATIYIYDDEKSYWGRILFNYLKGGSCKLFHRIEDVGDTGYVFMNVAHYPFEERDKNKEIMIELGKREGLKLIPSVKEVILHDDKITQYREFGNWLPETILVNDKEAALQNINKLGFPFVSKSRQGAGASNTRIIQSSEQAEKEVELVFSEKGLKCYKNSIQKDYVLWQKWIPGLEMNWRVVVLANKYFIVTKRWNEKGTKFVNDLSIIETLSYLDDKTKKIIGFAEKFARVNCFKWVAIDIAEEPETGKLYVLETSAGWPMGWFDEGIIFDKDLQPTIFSRNVLFLVGDMIQRGDFK